MRPRGDLEGRAPEVTRLLALKCRHAGISVPTAQTILQSKFVAEVESEWANMLAHQLPHLPPFAQFWGEVPGIFGWLNAVPVPPVAPIPVHKDHDPNWVAPRGMASWRCGPVRPTFPLELVRFAGANRLRVELDYQARDGRRGPRIVEPYALRRAKNGTLLLYVVNDRRELRNYDVTRIAGATITSETFVPRFRVEF